MDPSKRPTYRSTGFPVLTQNRAFFLRSKKVKTSLEISCRAREILSLAAEKHPEYATRLYGIKVEVSSRMTRCAGLAFQNQSLMKLSLPFYADPANFSSDLENTVIHEAAHLILGYRSITGRIYKSHGPEWRAIHKILGGNGERCHKLLLAPEFRPQPVSMPCCKCGQPMLLNGRDAARYQKEINRGNWGPKTRVGYCHSGGICPAVQPRKLVQKGLDSQQS